MGFLLPRVPYPSPPRGFILVMGIHGALRFPLITEGKPTLVFGLALQGFVRKYYSGVSFVSTVNGVLTALPPLTQSPSWVILVMGIHGTLRFPLITEGRPTLVFGRGLCVCP